MADTPKVYKAINAVMGGLTQQGIGKDRESQGVGANFKFRGIDDVMNALSGQLVVNKLVMLPRVIGRTSEVRQSNNNKPIFVSFVEVEFDLVSVEDGSAHTIRTMGEAMDSSDKSTNKAMSAAYKYAALQAFCIPTEGLMPDADETTHDLADVTPKGQQNNAEPSQQQNNANGDVKPRRDPGEPEQGWGNWTDEFLAKIKAEFNEGKLVELLDNPDNRKFAAGTKKVDPAMHAAIGAAAKAQRDIIADGTPPF